MSEGTIKTKTAQIRNEFIIGANTKSRVANVLDDINDSKANKVDVDKTTTDLYRIVNELDSKIVSSSSTGVKGEAKPNSSPSEYNPIEYPNGLFEIWLVNTAGTYVNFKTEDGSPVVVTEDPDIINNNVQIWVTNGVSKKVTSPKLKPTQYISLFSESTFPLNGYAQRIHDGNIWELKAGTVSESTDIPGKSSKWTPVVEGSVELANTVGVSITPAGTNFIQELVGSDLNNTDLWSVGYLNANSAPATGVTTFRFSKKYYPIIKGSYSFRIAFYGNASVCFYDADKNIVGSLQKGDSNANIVVKSMDIPSNAVFVRISHFYGNGTLDGTAAGGHPTTNIYVKNNVKFYIPTEQVYMFSKSVDGVVNGILQNKYGVDIVHKDTEFLSAYIGSDVNDTNIWSTGFLRVDGTIEQGSNWYHTKDYILLAPSTYNYRFYYAGKARAILYDPVSKAVVTPLANTGSLDGHNGTFTIDTPMLLRFSFRTKIDEPDRINLISVKNTLDIVPKIVTSSNIKQYLPDVGSEMIRKSYRDANSPRTKRKIATFICDDGHINDKKWYIPLLAEYGIKSTLAISKHWAISNRPERLTESDIIQYHKDGHDVANHTVNHLYMNQMSLQDVDFEIRDNKLYLERLINEEVRMFVSPFGIRSADIDFIVSKYHKANFISGYGVDNPTPIDSFFINRVSFDVTRTGELIFDTRIKPAIDQANGNNQWLVFAVHSGYAEYELSNTVDRRQELRQTIEYLLSNGFEIMTASRAYDYWRNPVELGVRRFSSKYYALGMDGTEINTNYFS